MAIAFRSLGAIFCLHSRLMNCSISSVTSSSGQVDVNGASLHYESRGNANEAIICIPGALGTALTDFQPQLDGLSDLFTVVALDPRGYGQSRSSIQRDFPRDFLTRDAEDAAALMKCLGFASYHVMGWSDGANSAALLAIANPLNVKKLIMFGGNSFVSEEDISLYKSTSDISKWSQRMRTPLEAVYGTDLQSLWSRWNNAMIDIATNNDGGDIYRSRLGEIQARTLILHGAKDSMVPSFHPKIINEGITTSSLHIMKEGKHNLHLRYNDEFNAIVKTFLIN